MNPCLLASTGEYKDLMSYRIGGVVWTFLIASNGVDENCLCGLKMTIASTFSLGGNDEGATPKWAEMWESETRGSWAVTSQPMFCSASIMSFALLLRRSGTFSLNVIPMKRTFLPEGLFFANSWCSRLAAWSGM